MGAKRRRSSSGSGWAALSGGDLEAWAGERTASRGRSYQRNGAVEELGLSAAGELVARVRGESRYATRVGLRSGRGARARRLESLCSCPVGVGCKHAVAVVLEALARIEQGEALPRAEAGNERPERAAGAAAPASGRRSKPADLERYLASLEQGELVRLVLELRALHPEIDPELRRRRALSKGDVDGLVAQVRAELAKAEDAPWRSARYGEEVRVDLALVRRAFEDLLEAGAADAVLELGDELLELGGTELERGNDDIALELGDSLELVVRALRSSSLSDAEQVLYAIDRLLADEYGLADPFAPVLERRWSRRTWSAVADGLAARMEALRASGGGASRQRRGRSSRLLIHALDRAGREEEGDRVAEREAVENGSYLELVDRLLRGARLDEARAWAEKGYAALVDEQPGTASSLRERLTELARRRKQWELVAAYEAEGFFARPELSSFQTLCAASKKAGKEAEVRAAVLRELEAESGAASSRRWPLPPTGLPRSSDGWSLAAMDRRRRWGLLLELAIHEQRPDDVLRWHRLGDFGRPALRRAGSAEVRVADAVASSHPARALELYRAAVDALLEQAKPAAYAQAGELLLRVRELLRSSSRAGEWDELLAALRERHARKHRLMEVLDGLERRPVARRRRPRS